MTLHSTTEDRKGAYGNMKITRQLEVPDPQPQDELRSVTIGCWFEGEVDPTGGGFLRNLRMTNSRPSARECRVMADLLNELADAQDEASPA